MILAESSGINQSELVTPETLVLVLVYQQHYLSLSMVDYKNVVSKQQKLKLPYRVNYLLTKD
jgi:hypothetical protein